MGGHVAPISYNTDVYGQFTNGLVVWRILLNTDIYASALFKKKRFDLDTEWPARPDGPLVNTFALSAEGPRSSFGSSQTSDLRTSNLVATSIADTCSGFSAALAVYTKNTGRWRCAWERCGWACRIDHLQHRCLWEFTNGLVVWKILVSTDIYTLVVKNKTKQTKTQTKQLRYRVASSPWWSFLFLSFAFSS